MSSYSMMKHHQALFLILFFTLSFAGVELHKDEGGGKRHHLKSSHNAFRFFTSFETHNNTKITAQVGGTATLPCVVDDTTPATVTWIRKSDYQLLTVGLATYSSDERFHVEHVRHRGVWNLRIKSVSKDDEGIYECNLSLHPPESIFIEVSVVEAIAEINGSPDVHIHEGSTLKLECKIIQATENPSFVFWYHEDRMVNFNHQDGFSVLTIPRAPISPSPSSSSQKSRQIVASPNLQNLANDDDLDDDDVTQYDEADEDEQEMNVDADDEMETNPMLLDSHNIIESEGFHLIAETPTASSILLVNEVQFKHAGNYTCAPSNTRPTYINVHVLKGEKPAAMKTSNQSETAEMVASSTSNEGNKCVYQLNKWISILMLMCLYTFRLNES